RHDVHHGRGAKGARQLQRNRGEALQDRDGGFGYRPLQPTASTALTALTALTAMTALANPENNPASTRFSGCHWTPSSHCPAGWASSTPSITPCAASATTSRPGSTMFRAWWCRLLAVISRLPSVR